MNDQPDHRDLSLITPVLDDAINQLHPLDRTAILLRFFEQRDLRSVGEAIGSSEDGARKRVARALEKLHCLLSRQGVALSAATLGTALANHAVTAAPAGMAAAIAGTALTGAGVGSGVAAGLFTFAHAKVIVAGAIAVGGMAASLVIREEASIHLGEANALLHQQAIELAALEADNLRLIPVAAQAADAPPDERFRELLRLRGEVGLLRRQANALAGLHGENQRLKAQEATAPDEPRTPLQFQEESWAMMHNAKVWMLGFIYANSELGQFPDSFEAAAPFLPDELMEGVLERADQFEIVFQGSREELAEPARVIVLRQRFARQRPDGKWAKAYGFADGHSQWRVQDHPDFDAFESQFMVQTIDP